LIAILDEEALLSVCAYIDLNPVAAGIVALPEESPHTSIKERVDHVKATGRIADVSEIRKGSVAARKVSDGLERDLWLVPNRRSSKAGSIARRDAGGIHAGSVSDAGGLHESSGTRRQSVGDSGSGEHLYEAWQ